MRASIAQVLLDSGTAALVFLFVSMVLSLRWATAAGLSYAVFPAAIYYSTNILSESLFTFLLVGGVVAVAIGFRRDRLLLTALGGALLAFATLTRPIALPLPFLFAGVSLLYRGLSRRWLHYAMLILCLALVVAPWAIRCTRASRQLVLVQGIGPALFYVGTRSDWNQQDSGIWLRFSRTVDYGRRLAEARNAEEIANADRLGFPLGMQNIKSNPRGYLVSRVKSYPYLFMNSFDTFTGINKSFGTLWSEGDVLRLASKLLLMFVFAIAPFILAWIGLIPVRRNLAAMMGALVWLYVLAANLPMWVEYRFWVPAVPFMLAGATMGAHYLWARLRGKGSFDPQPAMMQVPDSRE